MVATNEQKRKVLVIFIQKEKFRELEIVQNH